MSTQNIVALTIALILILFAWSYIQTDSNSEGVQEFYTQAEIKDIKINPGEVNLYYVWLRGCPACAAQDLWLQEMKDKYPGLNVYKFNISTEANLLNDLAEAYEVPRTARGAVPANCVGDEFFIGFDAAGMEAKIKQCLAEDCLDPKEKLNI